MLSNREGHLNLKQNQTTRVYSSRSINSQPSSLNRIKPGSMCSKDSPIQTQFIFNTPQLLRRLKDVCTSAAAFYANPLGWLHKKVFFYE